MNNESFGERLQIIRKELKLSQKDFAAFVGVPQPSISAYENNRNSPTVDVLISIAQKTGLSLDWLCGLTSEPVQIKTVSDIAAFTFALLDSENIAAELEVHDYIHGGDIETEENRWYTRITFYGHEPHAPQNETVCSMLGAVNDVYQDFISYGISNQSYEFSKKEISERYKQWVIMKKHYPELSQKEQLERRIAFLNKNTAKPEET